ncbi:protein lin-52 homolog isoform X2 [Lineus longissimus]|uniref:protein lin-52 homolog isoform X2 n=1 Tax=Lineus longissimus TaxID=88925 RepID=UPI00315D362B
MASPSADLDQSLLSFERLDRASPDLWPEQIPGVSEFAALKHIKKEDTYGIGYKSKGKIAPHTPPKWMAELEKDDVDMLQEFGSLTTSQLIDKVRGLQNLAYQLGLDEAREMTRGKFLNILQKNKAPR